MGPTTGQLAYHLRDKAPVAQLTERIRYLHLPGIDAPTLGCPALYVELERRSAPALLQERFRSIERADPERYKHFLQESQAAAERRYAVYQQLAGVTVPVIPTPEEQPAAADGMEK